MFLLQDLNRALFPTSLHFLAASGLAYVHSLGVLHRDIRMGNILIRSLTPATSRYQTPLSYFFSSFSRRKALFVSDLLPGVRASQQLVSCFVISALLHCYFFCLFFCFVCLIFHRLITLFNLVMKVACTLD
jgi:serine/threonine protein kinase